MSLSNFQLNLIHQFKQIGQTVAPFEDGGILNYLFEPIVKNSNLSTNSTDNNSSITLLKLVEINDTYSFVISMIGHMLFDSLQNMNVYNVVSINRNEYNSSLTNRTSKNMTRKFTTIIIVECLFFLLSIILSMSHFVLIYCPFSFGQKTPLIYSKDFKSSKILKSSNVNTLSNGDKTLVYDVGNSFVNEQLPNSLSPGTVEWVQQSNARRLSINSSDIYINEAADKLKQFDQPPKDSMDSSTMTISNFSGANQVPRNQIVLPIISPSQYNARKKMYITVKFIIYTLICTLIFLCVICFYAMEATFINFTPETTENSTDMLHKTFKNALLHELFYKLPIYLQEIITQGQEETEKTFRVVEKEIEKQLLITADNITESLLKSYNLLPVIVTADSIAQSLNETALASQIINSQQIVLQQEFNSYIGELKGYSNILNKSLNFVCEQIQQNTTESVKCKELQIQSSVLLLDVNTQRFELESSGIIVFLMRDLNINLNTITDQLSIAKSRLNEKKSEVIQKMKSTFSLEEYNKQFTSIWKTLQNNTVDKVKSFLTTEKQQEIDNSVNLTCYIISIIGYILITFVLSSITFLITYCILYTVDAYERYLFSFRLIRNWMTQNYSFFGFKDVIMETIADTELCRYVSTDSGIVFTDLVLDVYIQYEWTNLILNNSKLSDESTNFINLPAPKHVFSTLLNKCQSSMSNNSQNYGLLKQLNYSGIICFEKILYSPKLQKIIKDAENSSVNEIVKMNFSEFIPPDLDSLTSLARKLSVYLDGKDYKPSIQEIIKFTTLKPKILNYLEEMRRFVQFNDPIYNVLDIVEQINNSYGLKFFKNLSADPQRLEEPIRPLFETSVQSLLKQADIMLNDQFEQLFSKILPCNNLNKLLLTMTNTFCDRKYSIILCLGSYILFICITYFLLLIILLIFVIYARKHTELVMYTKWENIPLHQSVELCHKLLTNN
ncbi:unnamed protein product [Heterobilharzia americana]|nr:unnamed protein product [Heterobilharzia americana]